MQFITQRETLEWLNACHVVYPDGDYFWQGFITIPDGMHHDQFFISETAKAQFLLARRLATWCSGRKAVLLTTVTTSRDDHYDLFFRTRCLLGDSRLLKDAPSCMVDLSHPREMQDLAILMLMMTAFNWEGWLITDDAQSIVNLGDEIIQWADVNPTRVEEMSEEAVNWGMSWAKSLWWPDAI